MIGTKTQTTPTIRLWRQSINSAIMSPIWRGLACSPVEMMNRVAHSTVHWNSVFRFSKNSLSCSINDIFPTSEACRSFTCLTSEWLCPKKRLCNMLNCPDSNKMEIEKLVMFPVSSECRRVGESLLSQIKQSRGGWKWAGRGDDVSRRGMCVIALYRGSLSASRTRCQGGVRDKTMMF